MTLCSRCRARVVDGARFCSECGSWVVHPPSSGATSPEASTGMEPMTVETGGIASRRPSADSARPPPFKTTDVHRTSPLSRESIPISRAPRTLADSSPPPMSVARSSPRPRRPLVGFLVSFQYEPLGTFWALGAGPNLIGRAGGAADVDVGLADITVSTEQAVLHVDVNVATIEDRGSTNGTVVNGQPIAAAARVPLRHGDRVRFGTFETMLVLVPRG